MKESDKITTEKVQYWRNGIMLTAQMNQETAKQLIDTKQAFVITCQAIGAIIDGKKAS